MTRLCLPWWGLPHRRRYIFLFGVSPWPRQAAWCGPCLRTPQPAVQWRQRLYADTLWFNYENSMWRVCSRSLWNGILGIQTAVMECSLYMWHVGWVVHVYMYLVRFVRLGVWFLSWRNGGVLHMRRSYPKGHYCERRDSIMASTRQQFNRGPLFNLRKLCNVALVWPYILTRNLWQYIVAFLEVRFVKLYNHAKIKQGTLAKCPPCERDFR